MVGFLVTEGMGINAIRELSAQCTKSEFAYRLRQEIYKRVIADQHLKDLEEQTIREQVTEKIEGLDYRHHRGKIKSILLLFNLATLLQNSQSNIRFQFDSFKNELWDIEHVRSVTTYTMDRHLDRIAWFTKCLNYLQSQENVDALQAEIESFIQLPQSEAGYEVFDPLYDKVLEYFHENTGEEAEHGIENLTLLDQRTNRSYKNAVFAVKRQRLARS